MRREERRKEMGVGEKGEEKPGEKEKMGENQERSGKETKGEGMQGWEQKGRQHKETEPEGKQEGRAAVRERLG